MSGTERPHEVLHQAWVALGSNIQPEMHLPWAIRELAAAGTIVRVARVWQSAPVGDTAQADFCNSAVLLRTTQTPFELKQDFLKIEERLGRRRDPSNRNAARTIDLDLVLYDHVVLQTTTLTLPDPDICTRAFLAVPLAELTPEYPHPLTGQSLSEIAARLGTSSLQPRSEIGLLTPRGN